MGDEREERRQQDLRDFEFYRRRLKPSATELFRLIDKPNNINVITKFDRQSRERDGGREPAAKPPEPKNIAMNVRPRPEWKYSGLLRRQAAEMVEAEVIWPLAAAVVVLGMVGWTGNLDRVMSVIAF